jgi:Ca2+-binding EF-hand superfamily protein
MWSKIDERFQGMNQAFMFFDKDNKSKINFSEF